MNAVMDDTRSVMVGVSKPAKSELMRAAPDHLKRNVQDDREPEPRDPTVAHEQPCDKRPGGGHQLYRDHGQACAQHNRPGAAPEDDLCPFIARYARCRQPDDDGIVSRQSYVDQDDLKKCDQWTIGD